MISRGKLFRNTKAALFALVLCGLLTGALAEPTAGQRYRRSGGDGLVAQAAAITGDDFPFVGETPRGVRIYARNAPRLQTLRAIDAGLTELFAVARRNGYRARLSYTDYTVFIARADRTRDSSGAYSPDIAVGAAQYAGSVYDKGGYVYAAGMVLSFQPAAFIIAEHERDWQRISNVARYEGEHLVLYHNDHRLFQQTMDHSRGGSHPILR